MATEKKKLIFNPLSGQFDNIVDVSALAETADLAAYQLLSQKGAANGYASLDGGGKVPSAQLPNNVMQYQGQYDAVTDLPLLVNGTGSAGDVYEVVVAGSSDFGAGVISFNVGDWVVYSGSIWEKSINSNEVVSVNGLTGAVTLTTTNIAEGTNLYYTTARFNTAFAGKTTDNLAEGVTNLYYTAARFNTAFAAKTTDNLIEGATNLYFTNARATAANAAALALKLNTTMNNLGTTAFNQTINPDSHNVRSIGAPTLKINTIWVSSAVKSDSFDVVTGTSNNSTIRGSLTYITSAPDGALIDSVLQNGPAGSRVGVISLNDAVNGSGPTGELFLGTGNKTAGTGNSGDVVVRTGTSTGGTRGKIRFIDSSLSGSSVGYVWALTNVTTGAGQWQVAPASGANTALSNLASVAINASLVPGTHNAIAIGDNNFKYTDGWFDSSVKSPRYDVVASGAGSITATGSLGAIGTGPDGSAIGAALQNNGANRIGLATNTDTNVNAVATQDVFIGSGNKTAGTGNSGSIKIRPGTSAGGTRGKILLEDGSLSGSAVGYVWSLTNTSSGAGQWQANSSPETFSAWSSSNQSITANTPTTLIYNNELYDADSLHNASNGQFVLKRNGKARVKCRCLSTAITPGGVFFGQLTVYKNGAAYKQLSGTWLANAGNTTYELGNGSCIIDGITTDVWTVVVYSTVAASVFNSSVECYLEMEMITK